MLQGFPTVKTELEMLLKQKLNPDVYLTLQVDSTIAARRKLALRKQENHKAEKERLEKLEKMKPADITNELLQSLLKTDDKLLEDLRSQ